jgi:hypothetical protein
MRWSERARRSPCSTTDAKSTDGERRPASDPLRLRRDSRRRHTGPSAGLRHRRARLKLQALCQHWNGTIHCNEQRDPAPAVGIDALCRKSDYSWLEHHTPFGRPRPTNRATARRELSLRVRPGDRPRTCDPWSPRTSTFSPTRRRVQNEWFCGKLVGITTRACAMESVGFRDTDHGEPKLPSANARCGYFFEGGKPLGRWWLPASRAVAICLR